VALVLIPVIFNAIMLLPELRLAIPSHNDDAFHYMFVQRASAALTNGDNPFDFWVPDLGLGFPQFLYYQHLPHLAVVLLHCVLPNRIGLLGIFNLVRFLLLIGFPLTVYWSMRTMGFSAVSAGTAAGFASLLSEGSAKQGFAYESYIWSGSGMYTQLWAMHLLFVWLACMQRLLSKGTGYLSAVIACSLIVLSHPLYAYMAALTVFPLLLVSAGRHSGKVWQQCFVRLTLVAALAAIITAYFWLPFLLLRAYFNLVYPHRLEIRHVRGAIGPHWNLFDGARIPTMTALLVLGVISGSVAGIARGRLALAVFAFWLLVYFAPLINPHILAMLPLDELLPYQRFVGGLDLGAILLVGIACEWLWERFGALPQPWCAIAPGLIVLLLMIPPLYERSERYTYNSEVMEEATMSSGVYADLGKLITTLKTLPSARVVLPMVESGLVLTFSDIAITYPGQMLSLNAPVLFDPFDPIDSDLFNVRYFVLPKYYRRVPKFLSQIQSTEQFTLYETGSSSYAQFAKVRWGQIDARGIVAAQQKLYSGNYEWLHGGYSVTRSFIRWDYPPSGRPITGDAGPGGPDSGTVADERVSPDSIDLAVDCREAATLIIKMTYHPHWRVTIDGRPQSTFMVSPSYIGVAVPVGHHEIRAEYRAGALKNSLLLLAALTLLLTIAFRRRLAWLEDILLGTEAISKRAGDV